jgi:hypothetical protein
VGYAIGKTGKIEQIGNLASIVNQNPGVLWLVSTKYTLPRLIAKAKTRKIITRYFP